MGEEMMKLIGIGIGIEFEFELLTTHITSGLDAHIWLLTWL